MLIKTLLKVGAAAGVVAAGVQLARKFELDKKAVALAYLAADKATNVANDLLTRIDDFFLGVEDDEETTQETKTAPTAGNGTHEPGVREMFGTAKATVGNLDNLR